MAVFKYRAITGREDIEEEGAVVAEDEERAKAKLRSLGFKHIRLRKLYGLSAFLKRFNADIK